VVGLHQLLEACLLGALHQLDLDLSEHLKQLPRSISSLQPRRLYINAARLSSL
jgi:hypothetical protein